MGSGRSGLAPDLKRSIDMAKKKGSPAQERVRAVFKAAIAYLVPLKDLVEKGYAEKAKRKKSFASALALGHLLRTAIHIVDGEPQVDPSKVLLSIGTVADVQVDQIHRYPDRIEVTHLWFPAAYSAADDYLTLCAYQVEKGYAFVNELTWKRREGKVILPLLSEFQDDGLHLYLMVAERTGQKYARSQYLGYST
jgi:hypothetical protein